MKCLCKITLNAIPPKTAPPSLNATADYTLWAAL